MHACKRGCGAGSRGAAFCNGGWWHALWLYVFTTYLQLQLKKRHRRQVVRAQKLCKKQVCKLSPALVGQQPSVARTLCVLPEDEQCKGSLKLREMVWSKWDEMISCIPKR